jgi:hypothetical protein
MTFSVILASTGMIQLKKVPGIDFQFIFIFIGSLIILLGISAAFGIKEMSGKKSQTNKERLGVK